MGGRVNPREFVRREDNGFVNRQTRGFPRAGHISALGIFREYVLSETPKGVRLVSARSGLPPLLPALVVGFAFGQLVKRARQRA